MRRFERKRSERNRLLRGLADQKQKLGNQEEKILVPHPSLKNTWIEKTIKK